MTLRLEPAPVAAVTAPKVSEDTPKKSVEEAPVEGETKKKATSRSRSRGPLGFFKTKKEEIKDKVEGEDKKEETPAVEPAATEDAPAGKCIKVKRRNESLLTRTCRASPSDRCYCRSSHHRCCSSS
jgi:hypothetical protein